MTTAEQRIRERMADRDQLLARLVSEVLGDRGEVYSGDVSTAWRTADACSWRDRSHAVYLAGAWLRAAEARGDLVSRLRTPDRGIARRYYGRTCRHD